MKPPIAAAAALLLASPAWAADPAVIEVKRLSLDTAIKVAQGAIAGCREKGIQISASVVDRDGVVQVTLRDSITAPITATISEMKARTAANFNAATSAMKERAASPIGRVPGLVMSAGGLPIQMGGSALVGAVGVSGAPAGEIDEECALAGIGTVQEELDLAL